MPQLDLSAFLTNFAWFVLVFFALYILLLKVFLPRLVKSFVFRTNFIQLLTSEAVQQRLVLDYTSANYQFLESVLNFSLIDNVLGSFKLSADFQSHASLVALFDVLNQESYISEAFEINDSDVFELNASLVRD